MVATDAYVAAVNDLDQIVMVAKLRRFEEFEDEAIAELITWLQDYPDNLKAIARGRYCSGLLRWGDSNWAEHSTDDLVVEASEELADGVVYLVELLQRKKYGEQPEA